MSLEGNAILGASFRDPSGYVSKQNGEIIRVVQPSYSENYQLLFTSGLYRVLTEKKLLISHEDIQEHGIPNAFKVLKPRQLSFISYPYEWSFSQFKDAALTTLEIQRLALEHGMALKDASAFNIQFVDGKPMLIDTLSFEKLKFQPWVAYAQFCRHFLAPLALMAYRDARLNQMFRAHLDGIPLAVASKLLRGGAGSIFGFSSICIYMRQAKRNSTGEMAQASSSLLIGSLRCMEQFRVLIRRCEN